MKKLEVLLLSTFVVFMAGCGSSSSSNSFTTSATVPDISSASQEILPVMQTANASITNPNSFQNQMLKVVTYSDPAHWADMFQEMAQKVLSTEEEIGVESVFNIVSQIQSNLDNMAGDEGAEIVDSACVAPVDIPGATATTLTSNESLIIPFYNDNAFLNTAGNGSYDCLITMPDGMGEMVNSYNYAFGIDTDADGSTYIRYLAASGIINNEDGLDYESYVFSFDSDNGQMSIDTALYADKDDTFAIRAAYEGDEAAHSFIFRSTIRGNLTNCTPTAADPNNEAKKVISKGVSQGADSGFVMKMQRKCQQESSGWSADPNYFCVDADTKDLAADDSICSAYEDEVEDAELLDTDTVPFSTDAFDNDNMITIQDRTWSTLGGAVLDPKFAANGSIYIDENGNVYAVYKDGQKAMAMMTTPTGDWNDLSISQANTLGDGDSISIAGFENVPYVAYYAQSPLPGIFVQKYEDETWTELDSITGVSSRNLQLASDASYLYLSYAVASADGPIRVFRLNMTDDAATWEAIGIDIINTTSYMYDMQVYDGTVYIAYVGTDSTNVLECEGACDSWTYVTSETDTLTADTVESISLAMKSSTPYVAYTLTASPFINVKSVAAGAWTLIGDAGFAPGNANGVHISMGGAQPYVAYVDAESGGLLTIQRYSMGTWQSAGNATIEDANSTVDYFLMFNGTPYMLYNDTSVNKLRVQKFE